MRLGVISSAISLIIIQPQRLCKNIFLDRFIAIKTKYIKVLSLQFVAVGISNK